MRDCGGVEVRVSEEDRSRSTTEWSSDLMDSNRQTGETWRRGAEGSGGDSRRETIDGDPDMYSVDEMGGLE